MTFTHEQNPTELPDHEFLDAIPLVRALAFGPLTDGHRGHYQAVAERAEPHPDGHVDETWGRATSTPHPLFDHGRLEHPVLDAARQRTWQPTQADLEQLYQIEVAHRADALRALSPAVAGALSKISASEAAGAGLCPLEVWEDQHTDAIPAVTEEVDGPLLDAHGKPIKKTLVLRAEVPAVDRMGVRSQLAARASMKPPASPAQASPQAGPVA